MITQTYSAADFSARLAAAAGAVQRGVPEPLFKPLGLLFQADVRRQFYTGVGPTGVPFQALARPRPDGSDKPLMNQGLLANSYVAEVTAAGVVVASAHPGAALHQLGGVIRPVRAKALTLPLTREAVRYGSPRRFPRPLFVRGGCLCEWQGTGRDRVLVRHYRFAAEVTVPARPVGFTEAALSDAAEMLADYYLSMAG
ncbi:phage virion morphogenesis protein [Limnoglobus roseus]|uniref:Virion morphogenesis protein n=1 Tax=Limnoglobus roseus TaxID=2598579 RepID=A0A5C1AJW4_9BACT|nr:phage virion morphogenesis protein [Limnoglobus roseus]QEL18306.1 virion morphogenesis protein [Limnoglobus roseus]